MYNKILLSFCIFTISFAASIFAQTTYESITYLKSDGKTYSNYTNLKSEFNSIFIYFPKDSEPLKHFQYINPNDFKVKEFNNDYFNKIIFKSGNYSTIQNSKFSEENLIIDQNEVFNYTNLNKKNVNNHYGLFWEGINQEGFGEIAYVWIIPDEFEFINFNCNREGDWVKRENSISFFGKNINDIVFQIKYKRKNITPNIFKGRKVKIKKKYEISNRHPILKIKDDDTADGDIISISLNGEWIIKGLKVEKKAIEIELFLKKGNNYLILYAENQGTIPPNTATIEFNKKKITLKSSEELGEGIEIFVK